MISYDEALKLIQSLRLESEAQTKPLEQCLHSILASKAHALVSSPPFTNSAMDGFAYCEKDLPGPFEVTGSIFAGSVKPDSLPGYKANGCVRIMTGAYLPDWADSVIPVENTQESEQGGKATITFSDPPKKGANIRRAGEDIGSGDCILAEGMRLTPERIMVAAAMGLRELSVRPSPEVIFLSTGDELCEPGTTLGPGQIFNSSKYFLTAAAQAAGLTSVRHLTVSDDRAEASALLQSLLAKVGPKVIISTGAVSAGVADFIPELGTELDFSPLFHKVAIRPGKPVYLAKRRDAVWLGLPGNPISTCAGWYFFALPLLHSLVGLRAPNLYNFKLNNDVRKPEHLRCFFRAEIRDNRAWVPQSQGSGHFASSINQDAFVILPEGTSLVRAETIVPGIYIS